MATDEKAFAEVAQAESAEEVAAALNIDLGIDADTEDDPRFKSHDTLKIAITFPVISHRVLEDFELYLHRTTKNITGSPSVLRRHVLLAASDVGLLNNVAEWDGERIGDPFWTGKLTAKVIGAEETPSRWIWLSGCVTGYIEYVKTIPPE